MKDAAMPGHVIAEELKERGIGLRGTDALELALLRAWQKENHEQ